MEKKLTLGLTISIISILLISSFTVLAASLPFERYGQANLDGGTVEDGYTVSSWIDGTQYGDNETYHGDGSYRIITDGDDETDTTVKSGGESEDTIVYRIEDQDGNVYIADETDTFDSGGDTAGDLNYASGSQPSTDVKINELVPQPDDAGNQYVYIYDPVNITLEDWELSDHDGFSATLDTLNTHYFDADNLLYVELDGTEPIGTDSGHLMLSWNPDTSGIADNNMVVMDRVEFGNQDTQPQNTTLVDYPGAPAQGEGLVRETDGVDTDDCDADFTVAAETGRHVTLTTASTEGGSVTTPGEGTYDHYQYNDVNIEATPDANYNFVEWTGDNGTIADTKTSSTTITMEGDYSITANFEGDVVPGPVYNLHVAKDEDAGDIILSWDEEPDADEYNIYHSTDQYADFGTWTVLDTVADLEYTDTGALGGDNYYIVRAENAAGEGANSSMGYCLENFYDSAEGGLHYTSIPNNFDFNGDGQLTSFDVIESITGGIDQQGNLDAVVKWDASERGYVESSTWDGFGNQWVDEFDIEPGDGIGLRMNDDVTWYLNATDAPHPTMEWNDTFYDSTDGGLHYTTVDMILRDDGESSAGKTSFDIIVQITGGLDQQGNLDAVVKWDASERGYVESSTWDGFGNQWVDEFDIEPGDGIGLRINDDVEWTRVLETEPVYD